MNFSDFLEIDLNTDAYSSNDLFFQKIIIILFWGVGLSVFSISVWAMIFKRYHNSDGEVGKCNFTHVAFIDGEEHLAFFSEDSSESIQVYAHLSAEKWIYSGKYKAEKNGDLTIRINGSEDNVVGFYKKRGCNGAK